jgi:hypothetical protein
VVGGDQGVVDGDGGERVPPRRQRRVLDPGGHELQVQVDPRLDGDGLVPPLYRLLHLGRAFARQPADLLDLGVGFGAGGRFGHLDVVR